MVLDYVHYRKQCKYNFCISATYMHSSFYFATVSTSESVISLLFLWTVFWAD